MKRLTVSECMSQDFIKVLENDHTDPQSPGTIFAIFSASTEVGDFCGLVTKLDIISQQHACFSEFMGDHPRFTIKPKTTVRQALSMMKKEKIDILPVLNKEKMFVGFVTEYHLLQALYQREHFLLHEVKKHKQLLLEENIRHQKAVQWAKDKIEHMQHSDSLTGLPNFVQIRDRIKQLLIETQRQHTQGAILLINLDNFKDINDLMGSRFGDIVLQHVAEKIAGSLRQQDILARKGGDEFIIVLHAINSTHDVILAAKHLLDVLARPTTVAGHEIYLTASVGISFYPQATENVDVLLSNADIALGQAKEAGKNTYQIFMQQMADKVKNSQKMEKNLRQALKNNELYICYQPQVEIKGSRIVGMEALLRWQNSELGLVLPTDFIPLAEKTGLIKPIGDWALNTACVQLKRWQQKKPGLRVAVNLSARQFQEMHSHNANQLIHSIEGALDAAQLPPELLEVEITESLIMKNYAAALVTLKKLKNLGVRISCDDFGTGYSSLNYLKRFPIDIIKIDKTFINDLVYDPVDIAIIRAILVMAQQLKIEVIAEGVENKEQLTILQDLGCKMVQGYYFSQPLSIEETDLILQTGL